MPSQNVTDRFVLRLAILYEFYRAEYASESDHASIAMSAVNKMGAPGPERKAAMKYLLQSRLVEGVIIPHGTTESINISGINNIGTDFVEKSICEATFQSVRDRLEEGEDLDGCAGKRRVFERIIPGIIGGRSGYEGLLAELCGIACRLIPSFTGP
ncbi:MAG: hypothetical protein MPJ78_19770 [Hyphomicrobiaceae bacterium]|nr:hypothetical protein [Hyphomicrobiaceae bacterium]